MNAPLPPDETKRLETLHRFAILDTLPEQAFDDLTLIAAQICQTPIALVSIVDESRQWFKSHMGLDTTETPRDLAFCAYAILHKHEILQVGDALLDARFANNSLVTGDPKIRFYAGTPLLVDDDQPIGTLCVIDRVPRVLDAPQKLALEALGRRVSALIEIRLVNQQLRVAHEQAQQADRLKSAFLATMSHELRTPLNSIIGFTGIILQELAGPLNTEQSKQLTMVQTSARHLLALINDVLDLSKIEAGKLQIESVPFDFDASVAKVINMVTPLAKQKGLAIGVEGNQAVGMVDGDARRVEQVLLNLANNAVKFTTRGEVVLHIEADTQQVVAHIRDTGPGIKKDDMATLFRAFRQIDDGLTRNHDGTGLGLVICRRLADLMGGRIDTDSTWGKGSTFSFTLPRKKAVPS